MEKKRNFWSLSKLEIAYLSFIALITLSWILITPFNGAPDEAMRYQIVDYIVQYNKIPYGEEAEIRNELYGTSYGFTPINSYIVSALFVKLGMLFTNKFSALIVFARLPNLIYMALMTLFAIRFAERIFCGLSRWIYILAATLLPECVFVFGYVNCDAMALMSIAWILFFLIEGRRTQWGWKECVWLGIGMGVCALSYYNAYSILIVAVLFCLLSVIMNKEIEHKCSFLLTRVLWVAVPAFLYAGWWFVRSGIHTQGDILGLTASREYSELYAAEQFKPSNRETPFNLGESVGEMFFGRQWLKNTMVSFVASFGWVSITMSDLYYRAYYIFAGMGLLGNVLPNRPVRKERCKDALLDMAMLLDVLLSFGMAVYYSYFCDFQAQGRYCLPMLFALMYFVTKGIDKWGELLSDVRRKVFQGMVCYAFIAFFLLAYIYAYLNAYFT